MEHSVPDSEIAVPDDETPAARCGYCGRPFTSERYHALHLGAAHWEECTDEERDRYEEVYDDESHDLFTFHVKVVVTLLVTYFTFTYIYGLLWA